MVPVRYGMIGFGGIAENRIAKEGFGLDSKRFAPHPRAQLCGACDQNPARRSAAEALGVEWYADSDSLIADSRIEAILIATNNRTHASLAKNALLAGKHVFLEKPAGVTEVEIKELVDIAQTKGLSLVVDHMMTKNSYNLLAREMVRGKAIGHLEHLVLHMEFPFGIESSEAATWRCADPGELGGPIGDVGSHCLYMAEFLSDDTIASLQCAYTPKHLSIAVEDGAVIHFTTQKGLTGTIRVAFDQPRGGLTTTLQNLGYELYGSEGAIFARATLFQLSGHADEPVGLTLESMQGSYHQKHTLGQVQNIYQSQIDEHVQSIRSGNRLSGLDALHNLQLILLAHASAKAGGTSLSSPQTN
jgi:predicted dehydrogenase